MGTGRRTNRQTYKQIETETDINRDKETETESDIQTGRQKDRHT